MSNNKRIRLYTIPSFIMNEVIDGSLNDSSFLLRCGYIVTSSFIKECVKLWNEDFMFDCDPESLFLRVTFNIIYPIELKKEYDLKQNVLDSEIQVVDSVFNKVAPNDRGKWMCILSSLAKKFTISGKDPEYYIPHVGINPVGKVVVSRIWGYEIIELLKNDYIPEVRFFTFKNSRQIKKICLYVDVI